MAQFQLHVWGGAFGLESIDFECLAAIKYCTQAFHRSGLDDQWEVVPSSDPSVCPSRMPPKTPNTLPRGSPPLVSTVT